MYTSPTQLNRSDSDAPRPAADPVLEPVQHRHDPKMTGHGKSHHWMHLLMCAPMLLIVAGYLWTGPAGGVMAAAIPALGCVVIMWLMMRMMNHGADHHRAKNLAPRAHQQIGRAHV